MTHRSHNLLTATGDLTDSFSGFAVEHLVLDPSAWTSSTELLEAYYLWGRRKEMPKDVTAGNSASGAATALKASDAAQRAPKSRGTPECASRPKTRSRHERDA